MNYEHNPEDTGECWFDESGAEFKMVNFLVSKMNDGVEYSNSSTTKILDLGTGNGHLLFELSEELANEYDGDSTFAFTGVDYSRESVRFASEISRHREDASQFAFQHVDLLARESTFIKDHEQSFDVLLDKGTLDAIALNTSPLDDYEGRIGQDVYADQVIQLMHEKLLLLITLCNFTDTELTRIVTATGKLKVCDQIKYPTFKFGNVGGSTICTLGFQRV